MTRAIFSFPKWSQERHAEKLEDPSGFNGMIAVSSHSCHVLHVAVIREHIKSSSRNAVDARGRTARSLLLHDSARSHHRTIIHSLKRHSSWGLRELLFVFSCYQISISPTRDKFHSVKFFQSIQSGSSLHCRQKNTWLVRMRWMNALLRSYMYKSVWSYKGKGRLRFEKAMRNERPLATITRGNLRKIIHLYLCLISHSSLVLRFILACVTEINN